MLISSVAANTSLVHCHRKDKPERVKMLDPNSDEFTQEREVVRAKSPTELLQPLLPFQVRAQKAALGGVVVVDGNGKLLYFSPTGCCYCCCRRRVWAGCWGKRQVSSREAYLQMKWAWARPFRPSGCSLRPSDVM